MAISLVSFFANVNLVKERSQAAKVSTENADVLVYEMNYLNTLYTYEMSITRKIRIGFGCKLEDEKCSRKNRKITITMDAFSDCIFIANGISIGR
ncbi:MAG: hypothetical protein IPN09_04610 [Bacteroidetes bacterium]|nr:hypothetical protein [Bacteroidota bacterium]